MESFLQQQPIVTSNHFESINTFLWNGQQFFLRDHERVVEAVHVVEAAVRGGLHEPGAFVGALNARVAGDHRADEAAGEGATSSARDKAARITSAGPAPAAAASLLGRPRNTCSDRTVWRRPGTRSMADSSSVSAIDGGSADDGGTTKDWDFLLTVTFTMVAFAECGGRAQRPLKEFFLENTMPKLSSDQSAAWARKRIDKIRRSFLWKDKAETNGGHGLVS
ncbi:LOW QUALITY PROTEIN: hypothetical protein U9M48_042261 [Paspalum notatum var. saurae]|uniref:Uncharacterized protein n=1 Tax=Paspalum notatum var. saurae TaxID=547442 RepID=A0AAQ3US94_PASNO